MRFVVVEGFNAPELERQVNKYLTVASGELVGGVSADGMRLYQGMVIDGDKLAKHEQELKDGA